MDVNTIQVPYNEAIAKLEEYKGIPSKRRLVEDDELQKAYQAAVSGHRLLDLQKAFAQTGLNEQRQPRLAISRADWKNVMCSTWANPGPGWGIRFALDTRGSRISDIKVRMNKSYEELFQNALKSPVPHIPPSARPRFKLNNYHVLFEVKKWTVYPTDPLLLKRVSRNLFIVLAEWELTELEASILSGMDAGN